MPYDVNADLPASVRIRPLALMEFADRHYGHYGDTLFNLLSRRAAHSGHLASAAPLRSRVAAGRGGLR